MSTRNLPVYPTSASATVLREGGGRREMVFVYLGLHALVATVFWIGMTWVEAACCFAVLQLRGLCVSAGYHRLLAHRSFKTYRWLRFVLAAGACTALRGGPLWWVALHRFHHRHSDTEVDVFSADHSLWWSYGGWLLSGRFDHTDYERVRDLAHDPELRWLNRHWLLPPLLLAAATFLVGGGRGFVLCFCLPSILLLHSMAALDAFNHLVGRQRFDTGDRSRNNFLLSLLTNGEAWHNNHHHYPPSARQGFYWFELDGTYSFIVLLSWLGLAWDIKTPPRVILESKRLPPSDASSDVESDFVGPPHVAPSQRSATPRAALTRRG